MNCVTIYSYNSVIQSYAFSNGTGDVMGKVIAVTSGKGGTGKSTFLCLFGSESRRTGKTGLAH